MQVLGSTRKHLSLHRFPVFLIFDLACLFSFWTLGISWTAFYEITLVRQSIPLSVRPSLSFLKIGSLVFSDMHIMIADHDI